MYWSLLSRLRDVRKAQGLGWTDSDRHAFHKKVLGVMKSSKALTNGDLDKIKAAILAIVEPDNLVNQLRALDQPELRRAEAQVKAMEICEELQIGNRYAYDEHDLHSRRLAYLDGLVVKIYPAKKWWHQLDDKEANVVLGIMQRRMFAVRRRRQKEATPDPDNVPF